MHTFSVRIFYEDTDHSGFVYHANYLKYFERARESMIGFDVMRDIEHHDGLGFVVVRCELIFREGAVFGDELTILSSAEQASPYRLVCNQEARRGDRRLVDATVELAMITRDKKLVKLSEKVTRRFLNP